MQSPPSFPEHQFLCSDDIAAIDREHIWHPYASVSSPSPNYTVAHCEGVTLTLDNGRTLIDGMASWWSVIHGYNNPVLNQAIQDQTAKMAHVMFGGLTHEPAARLAKKLVDLTPTGLDRVFFADSGSVAVEVAMKMAIQYWHAKGKPQKHKMLSLRSGYHGDTFGAMSVCDPVTGMHQLFQGVLTQQFFTEMPQPEFNDEWRPEYSQDLIDQLEQHHQQIAAVILEPIVQGAGAMRFYAPEYLRQVRKLCDHYGILLIADEIATGFGRSGKLFACEHAGIAPDILCLGKALTGGYMTLAATLCTSAVAETICAGEAACFMHGPTFMANPLACAVANASLALLEANDWQRQVQFIEQQLTNELEVCASLNAVNKVRVLGAIGVVETHKPVDMKKMVPAFVERGVWVRPFVNRVYVMPPYCISAQELSRVTTAMIEVTREFG